MYDWYEGGMSLEDHLESALEVFLNGRQDYWDGNPLLPIMEEVAELSLRTLDDLITPEGTGQSHRLFRDPQLGEVLKKLEDVGLRDLVRERLEIAVARRFSLDTASKARRALDFSRMVMNGQPGERTLGYLRRLGRCYISGFDAECVILCRAVVENSLTDAFARRGLPIPEDGGGNSTMKQKLDSAVRFRFLSQHRRKDAWIIWQRGSKAVHEDPSVTKDIRGTVELTMGVLEELLPATLGN